MDYGWLGFCLLLASWLGVVLIGKIPAQLHTPLMSGTNAISGIALVGALIALEHTTDWFTQLLAYGSIFFAMVYVVGGSAVTDRMLKMFHTKDNVRK